MPRAKAGKAGKGHAPARRTRRRKPTDRDAVLRSAFDLPPRALELDGKEELFPDYVGMALGYVDAVLAGRVPENKFIILACRRFREMYDAALSGKAEYFWDERPVIACCEFLENLPQVQGAARAGDRLVLQPWQMWVVAAIFGFRQVVFGKSVRWTVEAFLDIPRKSGKSALTAGIDLYIFLYEDEVGSEIYLGATSRPQAAKVFHPFRRILLDEPDLVERFGLKVTLKEVRKPDGGFVTTVSAIGRKEDGHNPHVAHIDELHAVPQALHDVMDSAMGARANQLFLKTTTAGTKASGPAYAERKRAERVLRGQEKAPRYFCAIWTIDPEDQKVPLTWENVVKANPMLAVTISAQKVREDMEGARFSPSKKAEFVVKRLNVYAQGAAHAISPQEWADCRDPKLKLEAFKGRRAWVGADLSSHDDQTAVGIEFEDGDDLVVFAWHFIPAESPAFDNQDVVDQLRAWVADGFLTEFEGPLVDLDATEAFIEWLCRQFDVEAVVFDRAHSVQMAASLIKKGIKAGIIAANSVEMAEPTKDLIARARHRRLRHNGNPVLAWNAQNTCVTPGDLPRPVKDRTAPHLKIDGFSAITHANVARLGRAVPKMPDDKPPFDPNRVVRTL